MSDFDELLADRERDPRWLLICDHPPAVHWMPDRPMLFDPPGTFSRTSWWVKSRDDLAQRQDPTDWERHRLDQANLVLAWREKVPPAFRFWPE